MRRLQRWLISLTLAACAFTALTAENGIREDELRCEEAKKHLNDCCGNSYVGLDCTYVEGGCETQPIYPALDVPTAICLRDKSCAELQAFCTSAPGTTCE